MTRTLIIGFGNTLRGDDGAGVRAAERIAAEVPGAEVQTAQELQPELAELMSTYQRVVFIDASLRTTTLVVTPLEPSVVSSLSGTHAVTPEGLLALCGALYRVLPRQTMLIEIPAFACALGESMTEATARMVDRCVACVADILAGRPTPELPLTSSPPSSIA